MNIPRRIHMLWLQGWDRAPDLAKICAEGWGRLNPNHDVVLHDASSLDRQLAGFPVPVAELPPQAAADIFRASLLNSEGGIWADASLVPIQPLNDWFADMDAFGFSAVGGWQDGRVMENWFLASAPDHPTLSRFCTATAAYWTPERKSLIDVAWSGPGAGRVPVRQLKFRRKLGLLDPPADPSDYVRPDGPRRWRHVFPYFWFQYLFGYLAKSDPDFGKAWAQTPKLEPMAAQWMAWHLKSNPQAPLDDFEAARMRAPVQKFRFKKSIPAERQVEIARALIGKTG